MTDKNQRLQPNVSQILLIPFPSIPDQILQESEFSPNGTLESNPQNHRGSREGMTWFDPLMLLTDATLFSKGRLGNYVGCLTALFWNTFWARIQILCGLQVRKQGWVGRSHSYFQLWWNNFTSDAAKCRFCGEQCYTRWIFQIRWHTTNTQNTEVCTIFECILVSEHEWFLLSSNFSRIKKHSKSSQYPHLGWWFWAYILPSLCFCCLLSVSVLNPSVYFTKEIMM